MKQFCLKCGNVLTTIMVESTSRDMCLKCGWVYYPQRKVSAGCLIEKDGKLLLVKRATEPWLGSWYFPAGYVEVDESPRQAASREVKEETGLDVSVTSLFGLYSFDDDPRGNGILILYRGEINGGKFVCNSEVSELGFFSMQAIPQPLTGAGHADAIHDWILGNQSHA